MELLDSFGQTTLIRFSNGSSATRQLPATTFKFTPPAGVDVVGE
jgi:outer membrane lipoprotein carrier protein